jgi:hypothetical protein
MASAATDGAAGLRVDPGQARGINGKAEALARPHLRGWWGNDAGELPFDGASEQDV